MNHLIRLLDLARCFLFGAVIAPLVPSLSFAQAPEALLESFDLQIPVSPTPVKIEGKAQLVYELHLTNFTRTPLALTRVVVLGAGQDAGPKGAVLSELREAELLAQLGRLGNDPGLADKRSIALGMRAVLYFSLSLDPARAAPHKIKHRIEFDVVRESGRESRAMEGGEVNLRDASPVVLTPPLRGGPWAAIYSHAWERGHRRVIYTLNGRARIPARFAIDWIKLDSSGHFARGDHSKIANWYGHGAEVLAVKYGTVANLRDSIAESASLDDDRPANKLEDASGNFIALDLGQGLFAFYEHLEPGSVRVKIGEPVKAGQVIASLGNTGDSMGPHLHFHVSDANTPLEAEGMPFVFSGFDVLGGYKTIESFMKGSAWSPLPAEMNAKRSLEMPAPLTVVQFPGEKNQSP